MASRMPAQTSAAGTLASRRARGDDVVVHAAGLAAPGQRALEVVEQLIVAADPARDVVDPGAVGELAAAEIREAGIKADRRGGEQVELPAQGSR
jgi:G3E family GTPase